MLGHLSVRVLRIISLISSLSPSLLARSAGVSRLFCIKRKLIDYPLSGSAKDFVMIPSVPRVRFLDEDFEQDIDSLYEDDLGWEVVSP
jgi:hypothetical protein